MDVDVRKEPPLLISFLIFIGLILLPLILSDYWISQVIRYLLFGIFAMSLSLVWGRAGLLCFGQAMFFGFGGYSMGILTLGMLGGGIITLSWLALPIAVLLTCGFSLILGVFLFRGAGISGSYLAVVTLAIATLLEQLIRNSYFLGADNGLVGIPHLPTGGDPLNPIPDYYFVLAVTASVYFLLTRLLSSHFGIILAGIKLDPIRLEYLGYHVSRIRIFVFVLGAGIAALAGALFVATESFASPKLVGFALSAEVLIWVALGGRQIILAALLSASLVRWLEAILSGTLGDLWLLILGCIFMISVVFLPRGLIATPLGWLEDNFRFSFRKK